MESFFYKACKINEIEIKEFILRRYNDCNYILHMQYKDFIQFYDFAREKETEERIYKQWVVQLPFMTKDRFISFKEYKDQITLKNVDFRPTEIILAEIEEKEKKLAERG